MRLDSKQNRASNSQLGKNHKTNRRKKLVYKQKVWLYSKRDYKQGKISMVLKAILNHYINYQGKILSQTLAFKCTGILHTCYYLTLTQA